MPTPSLQSATASFAHLLGRAPKAAKAEDDQDEKDEKEGRRAAESDEDDAAHKAEEDENEKKTAADDKKKDDEDGDDDEADMKGKGERAAARRDERARCAAIFAAPEAASRLDFAKHLAFNTALSRRDALAMLKSVASCDGKTEKPRSGLADRMAAHVASPVAQVTATAASHLPNDPVAAAIIMAGKRRRAED